MLQTMPFGLRGCGACPRHSAERFVIFRHALEISLIPVVTMVGLTFALLISAGPSSRRGRVQLAWDCPRRGSRTRSGTVIIPLVQGITIFIGIIVIVVSLAHRPRECRNRSEDPVLTWPSPGLRAPSADGTVWRPARRTRTLARWMQPLRKGQGVQAKILLYSGPDLSRLLFIQPWRCWRRLSRRTSQPLQYALSRAIFLTRQAPSWRHPFGTNAPSASTFTGARPYTAPASRLRWLLSRPCLRPATEQ